MPGRLDTQVLTIQIQYCGGWGYGRYSHALRDYLKQTFGNTIKIVESMDRGITGNFEVTIVENGTLIHSKRGGGVDKATSARERKNIVEQIRVALDNV